MKLLKKSITIELIKTEAKTSFYGFETKLSRRQQANLSKKLYTPSKTTRTNILLKTVRTDQFYSFQEENFARFIDRYQFSFFENFGKISTWKILIDEVC